MPTPTNISVILCPILGISVAIICSTSADPNFWNKSESDQEAKTEKNHEGKSFSLKDNAPEDWKNFIRMLV